MRENLYHDGELYCEWRTNVFNCVDSKWFHDLHLAAFIIVGVDLVLCLAVLYYRVFIRKDNLATWKQGANLAMIGFSVMVFISFMYHMNVLFFPTPLGTNLFWAVHISFLNLPPTIYLGAIVDVLPETIIQQTLVSRARRLLPKSTRRNFIVFGFQLYLLGGNLITLGLVGHYENLNQPANEMIAFIVALTFSPINLMLYLSIYSFFAYHFLHVMFFYWSEMKLMHHKKSDIEDMGMNIKKVRQHIIMMIFNMTSYSLLMLLMAYYHNFFTNLVFSKAFAFIFIIVLEINATFALLSIIIVDIKKAKAKTTSLVSSASQTGSTPKISVLEHGIPVQMVEIDRRDSVV